MISVDFMERYYAPQLRYGLEPLLEAGCRPVWHCDGDMRLLLDVLIDAGVKGLQGFQPECGMVLEELVTRRTRDGEPLVIFGTVADGDCTACIRWGARSCGSCADRVK